MELFHPIWTNLNQGEQVPPRLQASSRHSKSEPFLCPNLLGCYSLLLMFFLGGYPPCCSPNCSHTPHPSQIDLAPGQGAPILLPPSLSHHAPALFFFFFFFKYGTRHEFAVSKQLLQPGFGGSHKQADSFSETTCIWTISSNI